MVSTPEPAGFVDKNWLISQYTFDLSGHLYICLTNPEVLGFLWEPIGHQYWSF